MDADVPQCEGLVRMSLSPLRQFVLGAALWLPMAFFLWAVLSSAVVWPVARATSVLLPAAWPDMVASVQQSGAVLEVTTQLATTGPDGRKGVLVLTVTPLIYAWCLALYAGLVMATPLDARGRLRQLAIGLPLLWLTTTWGAVFDVLKLLAFDAGPLGAAAVERVGLARDGVALGYQFGYLILPAVTPVALWVLQNRGFLERLVGAPVEPAGAGEGPRQTDGTSRTGERP